MFRAPRALDLSATIRKSTPASWRDEVPEDERLKVPLLPLTDGRQSTRAGWCTYAANIADAPDTEILCGGQNSKKPSAAAVWRQGWLLHFGFEPDPSILNGNGRALLENCIVYISGFTQDRPLVRTTSVFVSSRK